MIYFVATPIGNLGDLTDRSKDLFRSCDLVIAEDTRQTIKILNHLGVRKEIISFNVKSSESKLERISRKIKKSHITLYCSDAGTPNLSDPGFRIVKWALENNIEIHPLPGPSAVTALISICPFPCNEFVFKGYFPKKKGRMKMIEYIREADVPIFFFESPYRIDKTLKLLKEGLEKNYQIVIGRELTKKFEEVIISDISSINHDSIKNKGEFIFAIKKT